MELLDRPVAAATADRPPKASNSSATVSMPGTMMAPCHLVNHDSCHAPGITALAKDGGMPRYQRKAAYSLTQKQIGTRLKWARELVEPNRAEFARWMGVDRTTIQKIEDGDRAPSVFNILEFALALRVTADYLLFGAMRGIDGEMAARLAAAHPELVANQPSAAPHSAGNFADNSALKPRKPGRSRAVA